MTEQEYIEIMDKSNFMIDSANPYDMVIKEALEKQIPKKWDYEQGDETDIYICPCCKDRFVLEWGTPKDNEYNYCPSCGQRLDWSE